MRSAGLMLAAVAAALVALTVHLGRGLAFPPAVGAQPVPYGELVGVAMAVPAGAVVLFARPRNPIGWLLLAFAVFGTAQDAAAVYAVRAEARPEERLPGASLAYSLGVSLWVPAFAQLILLLVFYPNGRPQAAWWCWVNRTTVGSTALVTAALAMTPQQPRDRVWGEGPVLELPASWATALSLGGALLLAGAAVLVLGGALVRTWRSRAPERQQLLWLLISVALLLSVSFVPPWDWLFPIALGLIPCAVAVGVLWYRLLGIELIVRRTLLYGGLTALVLCLYAGVTAVVSAALPTGPVPAVAGAAVVATLLAPARDRFQRVVDRAVYGARNDPLRPFHRLGTEVSAVSAATVDVLPTVVAAVAAAVRAPYAAVVTAEGTLLAATGTMRAPTVVRPLTIARTHLADLVVCPADEDGLTAADAQIVDALTVPVSLIVHAQRLNVELVAARERAVGAALAERDRIRHDLHDGLGPSLSGVALGLEAVLEAVRTARTARMTRTTRTSGADGDVAPGTADVNRQVEELVGRLRAEVGRAVEDVRRIIDALRPSALERQDLVSALQERAAAITDRTGRRLTITVEATAPFPQLPLPVETAAYRIADEALTNVVRHARATRCVVSLSTSADSSTSTSTDAALTVEVRDNGRGPSSPSRGNDGVGLVSMRRRAEELGGTFRITADVTGNTVTAQLPLNTGQ